MIKLSSQDAMKLAAEDVIEGLEGMAHMLGRLHRACLMNKLKISDIQREAMRHSLASCNSLFSVIDDLSSM